MVAPSQVHLLHCCQHLRTEISVGAQNVSACGAGAYTGETSATQIEGLSSNEGVKRVSWVLCGHSERRALCDETNEVSCGCSVSHSWHASS
jgi:triosephosphate isomerase